ncbi:MAG TPA: helix-turn-helix domain-containing protein, partial [Lacipirellulaceae bacterium]|nr:helix-turn-helix domain-containing protein [Lacipirellulaceae bacterium]
DVIPTLEGYSWPGNVRQLQNAIDRAKILADDDRIRVENFPPEIINSAHARPPVALSDVDLETLTHQHVLDTYRRHSGNKARTARALGIGRRTLYRLLEKYNIAEKDAEGQVM